MANVWQLRSRTYRVSLIILILGLPVHLLAHVLPFWLDSEHKANLSKNPDEKIVDANVGLWQICVGYNCHFVHSITNEAVDNWFISVELLMLWALILHILAVTAGSLQNFVSRWAVSNMTSSFLKRLVHRDSEMAEDIGFLAGFVGQVALIVFMVLTKDVVSETGRYSWGFALSFLATGSAVLASLALTKAHVHSQPQFQPPRSQSSEAGNPNPSANWSTPRTSEQNEVLNMDAGSGGDVAMGGVSAQSVNPSVGHGEGSRTSPGRNRSSSQRHRSGTSGNNVPSREPRQVPATTQPRDMNALERTPRSYAIFGVRSRANTTGGL